MLDVGCGTGGSAFFMARQYGIHVHGVDLSSNMLAIAQDRLDRENKNVQAKVRNCLPPTPGPISLHTPTY